MLAAIGLYGVMSYMVSERQREFGIRLAFGARPSAIAVEILGSAGVLAIVSGAVGLALAAVASRLLSALIAGVRPSDPTTYLLAIVGMLGVALIACLGPGWRAISVNPLESLRE
jgi:putative ABC transport system permease protein